MPVNDSSEQQALIAAAEEVAVAAAQLSDALHAVAARSTLEAITPRITDQIARDNRELQLLDEPPNRDDEPPYETDQRGESPLAPREPNDIQAPPAGQGGPPAQYPPQDNALANRGGPPAIPPGSGGNDQLHPMMWALEATTQPRLIEIRDAILALQGNSDKGKKQGDEEKQKHEAGTFERFLDIAAQPGAGRNQSGSNLAKFTRHMIKFGSDTLSRVRKSLGKRSKAKPPSSKPPAGGGAKPPGPPIGGGAAGGAGGAAEGGAAAVEGGAVAGGIGLAEATGGLALFVVALFEAGKATYAFARAQENEVRKLADVGAAQARGIAILDAERTMRDVKTAEETGASSEKLTQSISAFEEALQPIESLLMNIANEIGADLLDQFTDLLNQVKPIVEAVNGLHAFFVGGKYKADEREKNMTSWESIDKMHKMQEEADKPKWPMNPVGNQRGA